MATTKAWQGAESTVKYAVHLGVWTNWSRGAIMGATLTLRRTEGNYLLAFTSLFITIVASCFWSIARRALHRCYSTSAPRDTLYHQQQAVLRNSSSAFESFQILCSLAWAWRRTVKGKRCLLRLVPGVLAAAFVVVSFAIASGFSSQIFQADDPNYDAHSRVPYRARMVTNDANYAQQCYSANSSSGIFDCTSFVRANLRSTIDTEAPCPFANGLCRSDNANIRLDTGHIDSNDDLGMNSPEGERILFRSVLSCAPLSTEGFSTNLTTETGDFTLYDYGNKTVGQNYTYRVRSLQEQYPADDIEGARGTNFVLASFAETNYQETTYTPSSSLQTDTEYFPKDGDLHLIFLSGNGIRFQEPVNDPWYRATVPTRPIVAATKPGTSAEHPAYRSEEAASPMACLEQFQLCYGSTSRCGPLASWLDAQDGASKLLNFPLEREGPPADNHPASRFYWFVALFTYAVPGLQPVLLQLGANSLASMRSLYAGVMGPLPDNQWQVDVMQWWATYLAGIQSAVVSIASGPIDPSLEHLRIRPYNQWIQDSICNNQIIRSSDYTSFSLFGLCFTYILGLIIVIVAFCLDPVLDTLSTRFHRGAYSYVEWTSTDTLQLQRMAFQGVKSGTWSGSASSVPVTSKAGEIMANLPFEYPISQLRSEKPGSNVAIKATAGTSVPTSPLKTSITPSKSIDTLKNSTRVGTISSMDMEVSPITPTITAAKSTKA
ncbi:hypothetical protein INS49_005505 [Diaporthe citri]|uniref:uncharacterized protein n=1 Tax=Diaporthe citri TaxID=83186 RepID=UPI001C7E7715|nr:uncharacterized protein INS49_005505 [Diaporthe citri]KAG6353543.1 hypothetical protein INS49_005505 [Diaporthe citri]